MGGQLLELNIKNLKYIKNVSVFRPSSVIYTAMERIATHIGLACLQQILN